METALAYLDKDAGGRRCLSAHVCSLSTPASPRRWTLEPVMRLETRISSSFPTAIPLVTAWTADLPGPHNGR
jgi:hypothetical protein